MKWVLVLIGIVNGSSESTIQGVYDRMVDCFDQREVVMWEQFATVDRPPPNYQLVCVLSDKY